MTEQPTAAVESIGEPATTDRTAIDTLIAAAEAVIACEPKPHPNGWYRRNTESAAAMVAISHTHIARLRDAVQAVQAAAA